MKNRKIEAAKGVVASVLVLLVASGVIDSKLSAAVTAVIASLLTLYAAFAVRVPKRPARDVEIKPGGSQ